MWEGAGGDRGEETYRSRKAEHMREILPTETMEKNSGRAWESDVHCTSFMTFLLGTFAWVSHDESLFYGVETYWEKCSQ